MKKVLVTGGNGFIGSHVIRRLLSLNLQPTIFSKNPIAQEQCSVFQGDILDKEACLEAISRHHAVIHLAAALGTRELASNPHLGIDTNVLGALNIFDSARMHDRPCVFLSVLNWFDRNPYAISKHAAEKFALMYNKEFGTRISVLRAGNVYGPGQKNAPVKKMVPNFIEAALSGQNILLYGGGEKISDTVFVSDVANAICHLLSSKNTKFDSIYEIGSGKPIRVIEVAEKILEITGSKSVLVKAEKRKGEDFGRDLVANLTELEASGFDTKNLVSLHDGLEQTVLSYMNAAKSFDIDNRRLSGRLHV